MAFGISISYGYPRPLPPLLLLPLLPLLLLPLEPDDRDGGDTDDPRELLPEDRGAAVLLGRDGRAAGLALLLGRDELGRAGRALLPDGRLVDDGRVVDGRRELPDGLTAWPEGRREVPLRMPSVLREPRVVVPGRIVPRVLVRTPEFPVPRVATVRVDMRPLASRDIAVRVAPRVEVREVRVLIRSREEEREAIWRLLTTITPG